MVVAAQTVCKHVCSRLSTHGLPHVFSGLCFSMFSLEVTPNGGERKNILHIEKGCGKQGEGESLARPGLGEAPDSGVACASKPGILPAGEG